MAWFILALAVSGNVMSNVFFKQAMAAFPAEVNFNTLLGFAFNPFLWLGGLSAVGMLACYLFSLKDMGLANTYATVTSLSLVGVTIVSAIAFREAISLQSLLGTALVVGGIFLISSAAPHGASEPTTAQITPPTAAHTAG